MLLEVLVLAVYGYEELRLCERLHELELLLTGVSRNVYLVHRLVYDLSARLHQLVDHACDELLVARDRSSGDDDEVHRRDVDLLVVVHRHARQRGHGLALTSRRDEDDALALVPVHHLDVDDDAVGHVEVAELYRRIYDVYHSPAEYCDLSAVALGAVDYLLYAVDIRRECRNDDALTLALLEEAVERLTDRALGVRIAHTLGVRGVSHERENALASELSEACEVDYLAVDRGVVYLEVACVYDDSRGSVYSHAH